MDFQMPGGEPLSKQELSLRHQTREFASEFAATIQQAADEIARTTDDRRVKEEAVRWKIGAIQSMRQATLRPSPTLALVDSWALCRQMTAFLESESGKQLFGSGEAIARTNVQALELRIATMARGELSSAELRQAENFLGGYVTNFPLQNLEFAREPLSGRWNAFRGDAPPTPAGTSSEALADLADRLQVLSEQVPAELRWRLSIEAGLWQETLLETRQTLRDIDVAMKGIASTVAATPATLSNAVHEIRALAPALTGLEKQWSLTLGAVDGQRAALAKDIAAERAAILLAVDQQRIALVQAVDQQRAALIKSVDEQRAAAMKEVHQMAADVTERSLQHVRGMAREAMIYGLIALVIVLGLPFCFGFLVGRATSLSDNRPGSSPK